ncbi:hypothetical protein BSKO_08892 [Bryopsis sp. KO-2023]|nr:hypothetical protein BSKO_08892 [Bryopsis sp. KO-2023]
MSRLRSSPVSVRFALLAGFSMVSLLWIVQYASWKDQPVLETNEEDLRLAATLNDRFAGDSEKIGSENRDACESISGSSEKKCCSGEFTCQASNTTIPCDWVNDDYCDCPDGGDEWLTSSCAQFGTLFECKNTSRYGKSISSSFVGDGICDCCDGSDEPLGKCSNSCHEWKSSDDGGSGSSGGGGVSRTRSRHVGM